MKNDSADKKKNEPTKALINTQNNTKTKIKAKRASPARIDPDCIYSYRSIPVSKAMVEKMAEELLEWPAKNPTAKTITEFYLSKDLTQQTYNRLVNKYDFLKEAHEITMRRLGERLWGRAVDNQAVWKPIHFMLHNYAPEFKEANDYHKEQKIEDNKKAGIIVVTIPEIKLDDKKVLE